MNRQLHHRTNKYKLLGKGYTINGSFYVKEANSLINLLSPPKGYSIDEDAFQRIDPSEHILRYTKDPITIYNLNNGR